ncbi:MAG TPA: TonB-dependent receptor, partial [Longimicrobiales bacterium]|nr:TonB-dependent receptor [Longimicrobiales bacterium]
MAPRVSRPIPAVLVALLLSIVSAFPAAAQSGRIIGQVRDSGTGEPLVAAQVEIEELDIVQVTGSNGRFVFVNVRPGVYTVSARQIGYATVRREGVQVSIDGTATIDFELPTEAVAVDPLVVEAERVPLITLDRTGSGETLTSSYMEAMPASSIVDVLELQSGFLQVPQNTEVISYAEERRGVTPLRIRGGRASETLMLVDGIPVNNFVLGGPAIDLTVEAVEQVDFKRGGFEPQYGNALSGIIDVATKEGGAFMSGAVHFRTSALGRLVGNGQDRVRDWNSIEGYISGPVPGTSQRLRFITAARQSYGPARVLEFDDDVFHPIRTPREDRLLKPFELDLVPGWQAFGYDATRDIFAKATYYFRPTAKLSATWLGYDRQTQGFDYAWMFAGVDPLDYAKTPEDSAAWGPPTNRFRTFRDLVQGSVRQQRNLYVLRWDHTLNRTAYQITAGLFDQSRVTCNFTQGVCLDSIFELPNFIDNFIAPSTGFANTPTVGTDFFFGGETIRTWVGRIDLNSQVTDNHAFRTGVFLQRHEVEYDEWQCSCLNTVAKLQNRWSAQPWDLAVYVQDKIELDFVTIDLGFRFDYGRAAASFFSNPLDPTNGTTALDVCREPERWQNQRVRYFDGTQVRDSIVSANLNWTASSCGDPENRALAAFIASGDDFAEAPARKQFSPRIGISFPVTATSNLFLNFGRYSQNPVLRNLYWHTAAGTAREGTPQAVDLNAFEAQRPFLGNPSLDIETTTAYELGYLAEISENYAFTAVAFAKNQTGLTGVRLVGQDPYPVFDPGVTYGSPSPQYLVLVNADYATARGIEFGFRRRLADHWGFDLNYTWSRARNNASEPERERERFDSEGIPFVLYEHRSEIDQPHVFHIALRFEGGETGPEFLGPRLADLLSDSRVSLTVQGSSGLPYTPIRGFGVSDISTRAERNEATGPFGWSVNLRLQ